MKAKKSLGQNFLQSESALNTIVEAGKVNSSDFILEIGPGRGALTEKLLETGAKVLAVEKDSELIEYLESKFYTYVQNGKLEVREGDVLEFDENLLEEEYKLIANIPYYITGAIIRKFLSSSNQPEKAVLLVQKEVAQRIVSRPELIGSDKNPKNKENLLSVSVKVYCEPKYIKTVPAGSFVPAPKVDSAIILLDNINNDNFISNNIEENMFFDILHAGFAHKRKVLRKNLEKLFKKEDISEILKKINKEEKVRAEDLSINDWISLTKNFS